MSNYRDGNVVVVDTSAAFTDIRNVESIKYIGASNGTASIKVESSSGQIIWEEAGSTNVYNAEVDLRSDKGIYVTVSNSAKVYLYVK